VTASAPPAPQLRIALISDIQYANIDDAHDHGGFELRTYAASLEHTRHAVRRWRALRPHPACVLQLGDLIDGQNSGSYGQGLRFEAPRSREALREALDALHGAPAPVYHAVGNHELYNFSWDELRAHLNAERDGVTHVVSRGERFYHSFSPAPGWRVVLLNAYELSEMQPAHLPGRAAAVELLRARNPNYGVPGRDFFEGLPPALQRFVPFNGGFGRRQLEWLGDTLSDAARAGERVCAASHLPLSPDAASHRNLAFDAEEALALLCARPGLVPVYLAGHRHQGGYARCAGGVHHVTLQAPLTHGLCDAHLDLFEDRAELVGAGRHRSYSLAFGARG